MDHYWIYISLLGTWRSWRLHRYIRIFEEMDNESFTEKSIAKYWHQEMLFSTFYSPLSDTQLRWTEHILYPETNHLKESLNCTVWINSICRMLEKMKTLKEKKNAMQLLPALPKSLVSAASRRSPARDRRFRVCPLLQTTQVSAASPWVYMLDANAQWALFVTPSSPARRYWRRPRQTHGHGKCPSANALPAATPPPPAHSHNYSVLSSQGL